MELEVAVVLGTSTALTIFAMSFTAWRESDHRRALADKDKFIEQLMDRLQSKTLYEYKSNQPKAKRDKPMRRPGYSDAELARLEESRLKPLEG